MKQLLAKKADKEMTRQKTAEIRGSALFRHVKGEGCIVTRFDFRGQVTCRRTAVFCWNFDGGCGRRRTRFAGTDRHFFERTHGNCVRSHKNALGNGIVSRIIAFRRRTVFVCLRIHGLRSSAKGLFSPAAISMEISLVAGL